MTMDQISLSLFAHIHNDSSLVGTHELEGNSFTNTIDCLKAHVLRLKQETAPDAPPSLAKTLTETLLFLEEEQRKIEAISAAPLNRQVEKMADLSQTIVKKIKSLSTEENLETGFFMPGGWSGKPIGHALLYEFRKDKDGSLIFIVHNTGTGLRYHDKSMLLDKERFCPIKAFKIPTPIQDFDAKMGWFITELIRPKLGNQKKSYDAKVLYTEIFPKIAYLDGVLVRTEEMPLYTKQEYETAGQRSGTCSEKVLHQLVQSKCQNKQEYKKFMYGFKKDMLSRFIDQSIQDKSIHLPAVRHQIALAFPNMARLLYKKEYFSEAERQAGQQELKQLQALFENAIKSPQAENELEAKIAASEAELQPNPVFDAFEAITPAPVIEIDSLSLSSEQNPFQINLPIEFDFSAKNSITQENLGLYLKQVNELQDNQAKLESLEHFLMRWPLSTSNTLSNPESTIADKKVFLTQLEQIHQVYLHSYHNLYGTQDLTQRRVVATLSFLSIIDDLVSKTHALHPILIEKIGLLLYNEKRNPFFSAQEAECDQKWMALKQKYETAFKMPESNPDERLKKRLADATYKCYLNLIETQPHLNSALASYFDILSAKNKEDDSSQGSPKSKKLTYLGYKENAHLKALYVLDEYLKLKPEQKKQWPEELAEALSKIEDHLSLFSQLDNTLSEALTGLTEQKLVSSVPSNHRDLLTYEETRYSFEAHAAMNFSELKAPYFKRTKEVPLFFEENLPSPVASLINHDGQNIAFAQSNKIQLDYPKPDKENFIQRELRHMRTAECAQLQVILDFFMDNLVLLEKKENQFYLESMLFEPGLIEVELNKNNGFLEKFQCLIEKGLHANSKGSIPDQTGLFFLQLSNAVNRYIGVKRKEDESYLVSDFIAQKDKQLFPQDAAEQNEIKSLHIESILLLAEKLSQNAEITLSDEEIGAYFKSKLIVNWIKTDEAFNASFKKDLLSRHCEQIERRWHTQNLKVEPDSKATSEQHLTESVKKCLAYLLPESQEYTTRYAPPKVLMLDAEGKSVMSVNLKLGEITKAGLKQVTLPKIITSDARFSMLFEQDIKMAWALEDNTVFTFEHKGDEYNIFLQASGAENTLPKIVIQKKYSVEGQDPEWFELQSIPETKKLPKILQEKNNVAWVRVDATKDPMALIGNLKKNTIDFIWDKIKSPNNLLQVAPYDHQNTPSQVKSSGFALLRKEDGIYQTFKDFESPELFFVLKNTPEPPNESNCIYKIHFPRYNLCLEGVGNPPTAYQLAGMQPPQTFNVSDQGKLSSQLLGGLKSTLLFTDEKGKKTLYCPMQPFIAKQDLEYTPPASSGLLAGRDDPDAHHTPSRNNPSLFFSGQSQNILQKNSSQRTEYYDLIQDVGDHLRNNFYTKAQKNLKANLTYTGTENVVSYEFKKDELTLLPKNIEDGLHLAYLYLCTQEPYKAFETLENLKVKFGMLNGTEKEIELLRWIVDLTPAKLEKLNPDSTVESAQTPEILSVKLKALSLLAKFKGDNSNFKLRKLEKSQEGYKEKGHEQNHAFYDNLNTKIIATYKAYHRTENNVPLEYKLSAYEKMLLLRDCSNKTGAVAIEYRRLEYQQLALEKKLLSEAEPQNTWSTERIKEIKAIMEKGKKYQAEETKTVEAIAPLTLADTSFELNIQELLALDNQNTEINLYTQIAAILNAEPVQELSEADLIKIISLPVDEKAFILYFPLLMKKIMADTLPELDKIKLQDFCKKTIIAFAEMDVQDRQQQNIPKLCSIIYAYLSSDPKPQSINYEDFKKAEGQDNFYKPGDISKIFTTLYKKAHAATVDQTLKPITYLKNQAHLKQMRYFPDESSILPEEEKKEQASNKLYTPLEKPTLGKFLNLNSESWKKHEAECNENLKAINLRYNAKMKESPLAYAKRFEELAKIDEEAGSMLNQLEKNQMHDAILLLDTPEKRQAIHAQALAYEQECSLDNPKILEALLVLANKTIANPEDKDNITPEVRRFQMEVMGLKRNKLTKQDLLRLYTLNDPNIYAEQTGLKPADIKFLHERIGIYLNAELNRQYVHRIAEKFKEYEPVLNNITISVDSSLELEQEPLHQAVHEIAKEMMSENFIDPKVHPELIVFQYAENILIKAAQKNAVESLLEKEADTGALKSKMIQLIMGGGKSKVLLPILALKRASGTNLSIIEVPEALFQTNYADLKKTSLSLFDQDPEPFSFDRDTPCSAKELKLLYRKIQAVMEARSYLVTTASSMQSLELKYFELLETPPKTKAQEPEWEKQIKWLGRILRTFKTQGDVLIDEIDSNLDVKKQLNYTIGESTHLPPHQVSYVLELYRYIHTQFPRPLDINTQPDLWISLSDKLVQDPNSPLNNIEKPTEKDKSALAAYLRGEGEIIPEYINKLSKKEKDLIFMTKAQISALMPQTMRYHLFEHYGPSLDQTKTALERAISIPYSGNMNPRENCTFSNPLMTLNYTIQQLETQGFKHNLSLFSYIIEHYVDSARRELIDSRDPDMLSLDQTEVGKKFNLALSALFPPLSTTLSNIDVNNPEQMLALHQQIQNLHEAGNHDLMYLALTEIILPTIKVDKKVLTHDAHNHVSLYRSTQGVTGTPWNNKTLHHSIEYNPLSSLGTDGLTIARLIDKKTELKGIDFKDKKNLFYALTDEMRAIIDVGATFKGMDNNAVAAELRSHFNAKNAKNENKKNLKYILFFDKNPHSGMDELNALNIDNLESKAIRIQGSDPKEIEGILGVKPNQCFTYYDQKHTIGSDIRQSPDAVALVTMDESTLQKDLLQGIMRMRNFKGAQRVVLCIDAPIFDNQTHEIKTIEAALAHARKNESARLMKDNLTSAIQQMKNTIRENIKKRIALASGKDHKEKRRLEEIFSAYFTNELAEDRMASYSTLEVMTDTEKLLGTISAQIKKEWLSLLEKNQIPILEQEVIDVNSEFLKITRNALNCCESQYLYSRQENNQVSENQKEKQQQKEQEQEKELEVKQKNHSFKYFDPWLKQLMQDSPTSVGKIVTYDYEVQHKQSLMQLCQNTDPKSYPRFNSEILASNNFYETLSKQETFLNPNQKPIHAILMMQIKNEQGGFDLRAIVITYPELQSIIQDMPKETEDVHFWVTNTQGTILAGNIPNKENLHPNYANFLTQLRFFNGDMAQLLAQSDESLVWLLNLPEENFSFMEQYILPYRPLTEERHTTALKKHIEDLKKAHIAICENKEIELDNPLNPMLSNFKATWAVLNTSPVDLKNTQLNKIYFSPYYFNLISTYASPEAKSHYFSLLCKQTPLPINLIDLSLDNFMHNQNQDPLLIFLEKEPFKSNREFKALLSSRFSEKMHDFEFSKRFFSLPEEFRKILTSKINQDDFFNIFMKNESNFIENFFMKLKYATEDKKSLKILVPLMGIENMRKLLGSFTEIQFLNCFNDLNKNTPSPQVQPPLFQINEIMSIFPADESFNLFEKSCTLKNINAILNESELEDSQTPFLTKKEALLDFLNTCPNDPADRRQNLFKSVLGIIEPRNLNLTILEKCLKYSNMSWLALVETYPDMAVKILKVCESNKKKAGSYEGFFEKNFSTVMADLKEKNKKQYDQILKQYFTQGDSGSSVFQTYQDTTDTQLQNAVTKGESKKIQEIFKTQADDSKKEALASNMLRNMCSNGTSGEIDAGFVFDTLLSYPQGLNLFREILTETNPENIKNWGEKGFYKLLLVKTKFFTSYKNSPEFDQDITQNLIDNKNLSFLAAVFRPKSNQDLTSYLEATNKLTTLYDKSDPDTQNKMTEGMKTFLLNIQDKIELRPNDKDLITLKQTLTETLGKLANPGAEPEPKKPKF